MKTFREAIQAVSTFLSVSVNTESGLPLIQRLHEAIPPTWTPPDETLRQQTIVILYCLYLLKQVHSSARAENWQLGIKDWRQVNALIEIIVVLGLYKSFALGVGVPESRRVKSILLAREGRQDAMSAAEKGLLLHAMVSDLRAVLEEGGEIAEMLRKKHLVDIVSGMADLAFNPAYPSEERIPSGSDYDTFMSKYLPPILSCVNIVCHYPLSWQLLLRSFILKLQHGFAHHSLDNSHQFQCKKTVTE